jgi:signal transduction histidine kinase
MLSQGSHYFVNFIVIGCAVLIFFIFFFYLLVIQLHKRQTVHQKEMFNLKTQYERTILQSQLEIQEQTFRNISQEIHDNIGQVLSLAKFNLNTITANSAPTKIALTEELLGKAINDLRDLSKSLHTEKINDIGLTNAIHHELTLLKKASKIKTTLIGQQVNLNVSKERAIIVFRMIQEILHNILKHAKAKHIGVEIKNQENEVHITITDDGKGFNIDNLKSADTGIGLKSIRQRCELINATCKIDSGEGKGTSIQLTMQNL